MEAPIKLPCGSTAYFDRESGISYRCDYCMAVVGSIGMPRECAEQFKMEEMLEVLAKGK